MAAWNPSSLFPRLSDRDFLSGAMFVAVGSVARYLSYEYPNGTFQQLGTGAFPMLVCWGLIVIGSILIVKSFFSPVEPATGWNLWVLIFITASIVFFQLTVDQFGLVVASAGLIALAAIGGGDARLKELIIFSVLFIAACSALFIVALGLPIEIFPWN